MSLLGCWLNVAVGLTLSTIPVEAAQLRSKDTVYPASSLARAYRQLGDLYGSGRLPTQKGEDIEDFLHIARQASSKASVISVIDPATIFGDLGRNERDGAHAVASYEVAGELGDAEALVRLGDLYREGLVVPKNLAMAVNFFRKARELGYSGARWRLAEMMLRGEGVPIDREGARAELQLAAQAGEATAWLILGNISASGEMGKIDAAAAVSAWQRAADSGEVRGLERLAELYYDGKIVSRDFVKAYRLFDAAGSKGDSYAAIRAAQMLIAGEGVRADRGAGVARLEALAAKEADGKAALADFYSSSVLSGDRFDPARAYALYVSAADEGSHYARLQMAIMQVNGEGAPTDTRAGLATLQAMAAEGYAAAAFALGNIYSIGHAGLLEPSKAISAYEQADKLGDRRAPLRLGDIFDEGKLVPRVPAKALAYYRSGAERGDVFARLKADAMVVEGTGTPKEAQVALADIRELAASGLVDATVLIGDLNKTGVPNLVLADEKAALKAYLAAADKGSQTAAVRAGEILIAGDQANRDQTRGISMMMTAAAENAAAYLDLGDALLKAGPERPKGSISPIEAFEKAGNSGITAAYLRLGDIYRDGVGVPVDGEKAVKYYMKAAGVNQAGDGTP